MVRIVIDCYDTDDVFDVKEVLMMALERLGRAQVVKVTNGKQEVKI